MSKHFSPEFWLLHHLCLCSAFVVPTAGYLEAVSCLVKSVND
jgi:hypothetical protein